MRESGWSEDERLHGALRDYYGTAMFNGNPMAMMELEEAERASGEELRRMARDAGIDVGSRYGSFGSSSPSANEPYGGYSGGSVGGVGVSASVHVEAVGPAATRFFERGAANRDAGFFANYGERLRVQAQLERLFENDED